MSRPRRRRLARVPLPVEALTPLLPALGLPDGCRVERFAVNARGEVSLIVAGPQLPLAARGIPQWAPATDTKEKEEDANIS